jgi:GNAT superfamily N-acetyltransferase
VTPTLEFREEAYDGPVVQSLVAALQQEYVARYGGPDTAPVHPAEFAPPTGRFLVGYLDAQPVASGGLRRIGADVVEIKRMYVVPSWRGHGLSRQVLARLEELAGRLGADRVVLETGLEQPEAMRLYETSGFERIEGFGHYKCNEHSVSYGKRLSG